MSQESRVSDEMLGAFVDGQLDGAEWASVARELDADERLREEVCRLRALKGMIRHAYPLPPAARRQRARFVVPGWLSLAAASLLFALAGWFGHAEFGRLPAMDAASANALIGDWDSLRKDWSARKEGKVLVHVSSSGREALSAALDEVEDLLGEASGYGRRLELEIVANGSGLDLFDAGDKALADRLASLRRAYPNLTFVACGQTINRRKSQGRTVNLVEGTTVAPSALHQVVERLRAGWIYVRA